MSEPATGSATSIWRHALDAINPRVVGMTALFALGRGFPVDLLGSGDAGPALAPLGRSELTGGLVLLFCALLLLRAPHMPRPLALALGVVAGCLLARALTSALDRLCDYLRAAFPLMRNRSSTLESELALAAAYLDVQRLRMGDRLAFDIDVAERDQRRDFPPMMLMSLVENAIKHGITPLAEGGRIRVSSESTADTLRVVVADTGAGMSMVRGSGVGLANIANRLAALYGSAARLTFAPNQPQGLRAMIEVPLPKAVAPS
jgi:hypothetical protein